MISTANIILKNKKNYFFPPKIRTNKDVSFISSQRCTEGSSQGSGKKKNKTHPRYYILIKGKIHQEDITIIYIYIPNNRVSNIWRK